MTNNSKIISFRQPGEIIDPLTDLLREGARSMLAKAIEAEVAEFLAGHADLKLPNGQNRLVRHGFGPPRSLQTGVGPVEVKRAKVRDRATGDDERIRFTSALLPLWARRTRSLDALLPILYLRGVSTGDFSEALSALLGKEAPNLSPSAITRLTGTWQDDYDQWQKRDLASRNYVYVWADGIYLQARSEDHAECVLVLIGATPEGRKEFIGFAMGKRESAQSWRELLVDLQSRGLTVAPKLAVGDGALGFWKALEEVFPSTAHQRCWFHKAGNILNRATKSVQPSMKEDLREISRAPDRKTALAAIQTFEKKYVAKYPEAVKGLTKDTDALLAFYDFPAEHWVHLRTTNPIESVFATVRHRTKRCKGAFSTKTIRLMVFKMVMAATKAFRKLKGENLLPKVIRNVRFNDGIEVIIPQHQNAA